MDRPSRVARGLAVLAWTMAASCAAARVPPATTSTAEGIRFALVDADAQSVAVAGTFNGWSITAHPLGRDRAGGVWTTTVVLPPGEHHFMFVVDGVVWVTPPSADAYVDDGFGSHNGVVIVGPGES